MIIPIAIAALLRSGLRRHRYPASRARQTFIRSPRATSSSGPPVARSEPSGRGEQILETPKSRRSSDRNENVVRPQHGVGGRLRVKLVTTAQAYDHRATADVADRLAAGFAALPRDDLLEAVFDVDIDYAAELRMQRKAGHLGAARLVGGDHAARPGALELLLGVLDARPGDDCDICAQLARGQRDE